MFHNLSPIYPFASENLAGYLPLLDLKGKTVLTPSDSGDPVLNAVCFGAAKIDAFDANLLSKFYTELKMAALRALSRTEYLAFFTLDAANSQVFSRIFFDQIAPELSVEARQAFDLFYRLFDGDGRALRESGLFRNKPLPDSRATIYNSYLANSNRYSQTRRRLKTEIYRWLHCTVQDLPDLLEPETQYDLILLADRIDRAYRLFPGPGHLEKFAGAVIGPLSGHLPEGGLICAICPGEGDGPGLFVPGNDFYLPEKRRAALSLPGLIYQEKTFPGNEAQRQDTLVTLQKSA